MLRKRALRFAFLVPAILLVFLPWLSLLLHVLLEGRAPADGWRLSARQWVLLGKSLLLAALGALGACSVGAAAAFLLAGVKRSVSEGLLLGALLTTLTVGPMLHAFGWQHMVGLQGGVPSASIWVVSEWAAWGWPVAAIFWVLGWHAAGRTGFEMALTYVGRHRAFWHGAWPTLWRYGAAAWLLLFILFAQEFSLPHAWGMPVYATELLVWTTSSRWSIDAVWPAVPSSLLTGLLVLATLRCIRRLKVRGDDGPEARWSPARRPPVPAWLGASFFTAFWLLTMGAPAAGLMGEFTTAEALKIAHLHGWDWGMTVGVMGLAGLLAMATAWGASFSDRFLAACWAIGLAGGALPGSLSGKAVGGLWSMSPWTQDHVFKLAAGMVCRYGWIPLTLVWLRHGWGGAKEEEQARVDGAGDWGVLWAVRLPRDRALLGMAVLLVMGQGLCDLATTTQTQVSLFHPAALLLIEAMHRFEDKAVAVICLSLTAAGWAIALTAFLMRRGLEQEGSWISKRGVGS